MFLFLYNENGDNMQDKHKNKIVQIIVAIIVLVGLGVLFCFFWKSDYEKIESEMKEVAINYIKDNKIEVKNQEYIPISDLGLATKVEMCSQASGVVVTNVSNKIEYKPYLKCLDYESDIVNNRQKYIELKGAEVVFVNAGSMYFDEGYTKIDENASVEIVGTVLTDPGAYTINYVIKKNGSQKEVVKRIVIVSPVDYRLTFSGLTDKEKPLIKLNGDQEEFVAEKAKYVDPGYRAYDFNDGDITKKVLIKGQVDTSKIGVYEIKYTVKNSKGKEMALTRKVHVVNKIADLNVTLATEEKLAPTNESKIIVKVTGDGFRKTILPNGEEDTSGTCTYSVIKNGTYTFKVVDIYDNIIPKSIVINNVDKNSPTGSCKVIVSDNLSTFNVTGNDENGISYVNYIIENNDSGFLQTTRYEIKEEISTAQVILKDVAGNTSTIECLIKK